MQSFASHSEHQRCVAVIDVLNFILTELLRICFLDLTSNDPIYHLFYCFALIMSHNVFAPPSSGVCRLLSWSAYFGQKIIIVKIFIYSVFADTEEVLRRPQYEITFCQHHLETWHSYYFEGLVVYMFTTADVQSERSVYDPWCRSINPSLVSGVWVVSSLNGARPAGYYMSVCSICDF